MTYTETAPMAPSTCSPKCHLAMGVKPFPCGSVSEAQPLAVPLAHVWGQLSTSGTPNSTAYASCSRHAKHLC